MSDEKQPNISEESSKPKKPTKTMPIKEKQDNSSIPMDKKALFDIDYLANKIVQKRKRPLLLMFYSPSLGKIVVGDIEYLEQVFNKYQKIKELDLIIFTKGGDVSTSYFLAQLIRANCEELETIVPFYSYSGGTVIALASDKIHMSNVSKISPIDVQIGNKDFSLSLINFDKFIEFLNETSQNFVFKKEKNRAEFIIRLMEAFLKTSSPLEIGQFYRMRKMHEYYAKKLLMDYMFKNDSQRLDKSLKIVNELTSECPDHNFDIDLGIAKDIGIKVDLLDEEVYDIGKALIEACIINKRMGIICPFTSKESNFRIPFFQLYGVNKRKGEKNE